MPLLFRLLFIGYGLAMKVVDAACPRNRNTDRICSGFGTCSSTGECTCDSKHTGTTCSLEICPKDLAWDHAAAGNDDVHVEAQCSHRGTCDFDSGKCICDEAFTGSACQRLRCPNDCSNNGQCLSMKEFAEHNPNGPEFSYTSPWDAEKIYGCLCDPGYEGPDCSQIQCPKGDDPLTTGQVNELQLLSCSATSGSFDVSFNRVSTTLSALASASEVQLALEALSSVHPPVEVTYSTGTTLCSSSPINTVSVEFTQNFGPQPPLKVVANAPLVGGTVQVAHAGSTLNGVASVAGSKENAVCSNRGECDFVTGKCSCYKVPMPGYVSSNGLGQPGTRGDCGAADNLNLYGGAITACPGEVSCSGHGTCSSSFACSCVDHWYGGECGLKSCPTGLSWFDYPTAAQDAHNTKTTCSDGGLCDTTTGVCACFPPYTGSACEFMDCPRGSESSSEPCSGHGLCMSNRQLATETIVADESTDFTYGLDPNDPQTWDGSKIYGCKCDAGYTGHACGQRTCPTGDDPVTTGQSDEIQLLQCDATGGTFTLRFQRWTTVPLSFSASASDVKAALLLLPTIEDIQVSYSHSATNACSDQSSAHVIQVTFTHNPGPLTAIQAGASGLTGGSSSLVVATGGTALASVSSVPGSKENVVCSNHGVCDEDTGVCTCVPGYGSSNGLGGLGDKRDCGYQRPWRYEAQ